MAKINITISAEEGYVCEFMRELATAIEDGAVRTNYETPYGTAHFDTDMGEDEDAELTDDLKKKIVATIGDEYSESEIEENLTNLLGKKVSWYDGGIDDGADGEDEYVMKACFKVEDSDITIRVYYGDYTLGIGYVDVREY